MRKEAVYHVCDIPYAFPVGKKQLKVRLRAARNDVQECSVFHADRYDVDNTGEEQTQLLRSSWDENFDYFEGIILAETKRVKYKFFLKGQDGEEAWFGENGFSEEYGKAGVFQFPFICESEIVKNPEWTKKAVVYQILPDRFCNGDTSIDPECTQPWDTEPSGDSFFGGDLKGILQKLDYLEELGINLIYLTPIFTSPSSHKYDAVDYFHVDPHFGDLELVKELVNQAHKKGIRIILDATFNHCSEHFFAFEDVMKNGETSRYKDWFTIYNFPVVQSPKPNYDTFGYLGMMPKLRMDQESVREYFIRVGVFWMQNAGIDGWRMDVANEIDHDFWRIFRKKVKEVKSDAIIIGEMWHNAGPWLRGDQFDGITNYKFREAVHSFFAENSLKVSEFNSLLTKNRMEYSDQVAQMMFNLFDSHDTERFLTDCISLWEKKDKERPLKLMKLAVLFQMTYVGIPVVYYGDEVGMLGTMDPGCRKPMIWEKEKQNRELLAFYQTLIHFRKDSKALTEGGFQTWIEEDKQGVFGYIRSTEKEAVGILINNSSETCVVKAEMSWKKVDGSITDVLTGNVFSGEETITFEIPPFSGLLLYQ